MADNPIAGVSGPGSYSKRTDVGTPEMKMGSIAYGEGVETQEIKSGAPLSKSEETRATPASEVRAAAQSQVPGLYDDTVRASEPVTSGINRGEGVGANALGMKKVQTKLSDTLATMLPFDTTGEITILYQDALAQGN